MSDANLHRSSSKLRSRLTRDERRRSILLAAQHAFATEGYHGASTAGIARAAGCSEPMIYKHFASKQDLFTAALLSSYSVIERGFELTLATDGDIYTNLLTTLPKLMDDPRYVEMLLLRRHAVAVVKFPQVHLALETMASQHLERVTRYVHRGISEGTIHPSTDPEYVAWTFVGMLEAGCHREALRAGGFKGMMPHIAQFLAHLRV